MCADASLIRRRRFPSRSVGVSADRVAAVRCRLRSAARKALDLVFPPHCLFCERDLAVGRRVLLCNECRRALSQSTPRCPRCGMAAEPMALRERGCLRCQAERFRFQQVIALGGYRGPLREAVLRMKHPRDDALALAMGHLLWQARSAELAAAQPTVVAPIPMHWTRRLIRHTNSAELLAGVLAHRLRIPLRRLLRRTRRTRPQGSLSASRRRQNVRGAFAVRHRSPCRGAAVLLVDDVLTTGSTAHEAARALLKTGASRVIVAVLARSESDD